MLTHFTSSAGEISFTINIPTSPSTVDKKGNYYTSVYQIY